MSKMLAGSLFSLNYHKMIFWIVSIFLEENNNFYPLFMAWLFQVSYSNYCPIILNEKFYKWALNSVTKYYIVLLHHAQLINLPCPVSPSSSYLLFTTYSVVTSGYQINCVVSHCCVQVALILASDKPVCLL